MRFWEWFAEVINFSSGSVLTGLGALGAGALALLGVVISTRQSAIRSEKALASAAEDRKQNAEQHRDVLERGRREQEALELREKEASRHARFSKVVEQLSSDKAAVRMGGLHSLSALADEWDQEARRLLGDNLPPLSDQSSLPPQMRRLIEPLDREKVDAVAQDAVGQRDACIGLLCSYLRAKPIISTPGEEWVDHHEPQFKIPFNQPAAPPDFPDWDARAAAVAVIRRHLEPGANHPWPGGLINLGGADLRYQAFSGGHWIGGWFAGALLDYASLDSSLFAFTSFDGASLTQVSAAMSIFLSAHLKDTTLTHSFLLCTKLQVSDLRRADLRHTNFMRAELWDSDLSGTKLEDANLSEAEIKSTHGTEYSIFLPSKRDDHSIPTWNDGTRWPPGFSPNQLLAEHEEARKRTDPLQGTGYA